MPTDRPTSLVGGVRHAWTLPRYAGTKMRSFWRILALGTAAQVVLFGIIFVPGLRRSPWSAAWMGGPQIAMTLCFLALIGYHFRVRRSLRQAPLCPGCGYTAGDLECCPECGLALSPAERLEAWRDAGYRA